MEMYSTQVVGDSPSSTRREQAPLVALMLDISGDTQTPAPVVAVGDRCACCGLRTSKLWEGARAASPDLHAVCTLCYLAGHLDSPTAAHGRLAFLPGMAMADVHHLQRRAHFAMLGGTPTQRREGQRVWRWLLLHSREVETAWGTARAGEFAAALKRLAPHKRLKLQTRLAGCALILPVDVFDDLSLLLPAGKTVEAALTPRSWGTYTRSDLYAETNTLG
ncbi:conjugal transfer protein TraT [Pseudomonas sp. 5S4]|nr:MULTISPECIES: conjugal transfer protein TraT [unclassified Pseudomonas]MDY7563408.1 conjugal transfer protein TraT [Pseudomonas sp. AB6]MEA9996478.1 conjugal transfer protein TraT [Pseudomonas sp. AA4]MEB0198148.1 conjugal transfer protein TraT [Pseudomonas sp. 5S4]MEB0213363.1 conjugal transfer protein TraT [Pseudomonas sp. AB6]MEB0222079.1 conjugal transfer protein TraT [Pseudomonas sp. AB12(2023)]